MPTAIAGHTCPRCEAQLIEGHDGDHECLTCGYVDYSPSQPRAPRSPQPVRIPLRYIGDDDRWRGVITWATLELRDSGSPWAIVRPSVVIECVFCSQLAHKTGQARTRHLGKRVQKGGRYSCPNGHVLSSDGASGWW